MDTIYHNGSIYSIDEENRCYSAIGVEKGRIVFLGSEEEAEEKQAEKRVDLRGKTVLPGFIDSHLHMLNYALVAESYQMFEMNSIEEIIAEGRKLVEEMKGQLAAQAVRQAAGQMAAQPVEGMNSGAAERWLYGRGWNQQRFRDEKRLLTKEDLDQISTEHPILFIRVCGHVAAVNSKGLEIVMALEQTKEFLDQIDVKRGILTEASVKLCYNAMDKPSVERIKGLILKAQKDFNRRGITSVQSDNFLSLPGRDRESIVKAHQQLDQEGRLTVRIREQASFTLFEDMKAFIDEGFRTGQGSEHYRIGPVKLYEDGSLGARTALLHQPYCDDPTTCGLMVHSPEDLQNCVDYAYRHGMQLLVHAIGDRASDMVCDAYEAVISKYGRRERSLAINHVQIVSGTLFERMAQNGIMAYIQPLFVASDKEILRDFIGEERTSRSYGWKTMMDHGILCCASSDSPVEDCDVLAGIQTAVTRTRLDEVSEGWRPEEKLSVLEAVKLFTINNACAASEEKEKGSLEIGKLADFTVLDQDLFTADPHSIAKIPVVRTVVGGEDVFVL